MNLGSLIQPSKILPIELTRTDENQQAFKDPLHIPVGPITKARSKKIKDALNGLIQMWDIPSWAQRKMKAK